MSLWEGAASRAREWDATAAAYDRHRPRYPAALFDAVAAFGRLPAGARVIEIGPGTGLATAPMASLGWNVTGVEPAPGMAALARSKLGDAVRIVDGRFEDYAGDGPVDLVAAFNAWHWIEPAAGVSLLTRLLRPGGVVALVWTEVAAWGQEPFERRLAEELGAPFPAVPATVAAARGVIEDSGGFEPFEVQRFRFERSLDADAYVAAMHTYGGPHTAGRDAAVRRVIAELGGRVTKVEDAVAYLTRRR